jgi:hypothetical protein
MFIRKPQKVHMSGTNHVVRHRLAGTIVATVGAVALIPASASAATTWFGSSLNHDPANAGNTCADNGVSGPALCTHVGSYYPGTSGRAQAPVDGTITAFRVDAEGPATITFRLVTVRNLAANEQSGQAKVVVQGPTVQVHGPTQTQSDNGIYPIETFHVKLKVKKGEELAIDTTSNTAEYCSDGTPGQLLFDPQLNLGQGFRSSNGVDNCLMLVQAVIRH